MSRVVLHDIARAARVSVSTVSLALSGARRVAPRTQQRIARIAERLGYVRREPRTAAEGWSAYLAPDVIESLAGDTLPQAEPKRIALKDIAARAAVSISTVSLALAGDARVSLATRQHLTQLAHDLGYVRNPLLSGLASSRLRHTGKPAVIVMLTTQAGDSTMLAQHARQMGMVLRELSPAALSKLTTTAALISRLSELEAAAVVVHRRGIDPAIIAALPLPVVVWDDDNPGELTVDVVEIADWWSTLGATLAQVRRMGYRRPAFIHIPAVPRHWHDDVRLAAARQSGMPVCETTRDGTPEVVAFLDRHQPDAVIGLVPFVREMLIRFDRRIPVASMILVHGHWSDGLAGMLPDFAHRCRTTCEIIEHRLRFGPRPPRRVILPPRWLDGPSLPAVE